MRRFFAITNHKPDTRTPPECQGRGIGNPHVRVGVMAGGAPLGKHMGRARGSSRNIRHEQPVGMRSWKLHGRRVVKHSPQSAVVTPVVFIVAPAMASAMIAPIVPPMIAGSPKPNSS
jgi:hypothetical protein